MTERTLWRLNSEGLSALCVGVLCGVFVGCAGPGAGTPEIQDLNALERVADELERDGNYALAREQLAAIVAATEDSDRAGALTLRGCDTYRRENRYDDARRCYLSAAPNVLPRVKAEARLRAAKMEVRLGRVSRAQIALEALVIDQPSSPAALSGARYLLELRDEDAVDSEQETRVRLGRRLALALEPQSKRDASVRTLCTFLW
ncbi:MAG: hypothetical protein AAFY60_16755, partial [Myxococcota bacterium]